MGNERHTKILEEIIRFYVQTGTPVASAQLVGMLPFSISSATIRNEMARLEEEGMLMQPHTSAGRIPTIDAFRFLVGELLADRAVRLTVSSSRPLVPSREAKKLARVAGVTAFVSLGGSMAFAGFEFVLRAPELRDELTLADFAKLLDSAASWEQVLWEALDEPVGIFIGEQNPLVESNAFSVVACRFPRRGVAALIGPVRMNYKQAVQSLFSFFQ